MCGPFSTGAQPLRGCWRTGNVDVGIPSQISQEGQSEGGASLRALHGLWRVWGVAPAPGRGARCEPRKHEPYRIASQLDEEGAHLDRSDRSETKQAANRSNPSLTVTGRAIDLLAVFRGRSTEWPIGIGTREIRRGTKGGGNEDREERSRASVTRDRSIDPTLVSPANGEKSVRRSKNFGRYPRRDATPRHAGREG